MTRINLRRIALSLVALFAVAAFFGSASEAKAAQPALKITGKLDVQKINSNLCKVRLKVTVSVPNLSPMTFYSPWVYVTKEGTISIPLPLPPSLTSSGYIKWEGNKIHGKVTIKFDSGVGLKLQNTFYFSNNV